MDIRTPTCRFFDPSKQNADGLHGESGDEFPFSNHMDFDSCWSKDRGASETNWTTCNQLNDHTECPYYQPSPRKLMRLVRVQRGIDEWLFLALDRQRISKVGFAEYRFYSWSSHSEEAVRPEILTEVVSRNAYETVDAYQSLVVMLEQRATQVSMGHPERITKLPIAHEAHAPKNSFLASLKG